MRRHPSPSRGVRARASSGGYGAKSSKISLVVSLVLTACALVSLVRGGTRANEANEALQRAMSEVATYEHRVETLERELRSAEAVKEAATKTEATLRETREALDEAKREAAKSNAEAARAKMRAEDVETEAMLEKARGGRRDWRRWAAATRRASGAGRRRGRFRGEGDAGCERRGVRG